MIVKLKYFLGVLNALLLLLMASSFSDLHFTSQQIRSLRIRNERTKRGYVRAVEATRVPGGGSEEPGLGWLGSVGELLALRFLLSRVTSMNPSP